MKFSEIIKKWPANTLATSKWLSSRGISRQLLAKYCQSGWLEKVDNGIYKKAGETVDWTSAVFALQQQLGMEVYPEGYTALELHGFQHHVSVTHTDIYLSGTPKTVLPRWFLKFDTKTRMHFRTSKTLPAKSGFIDKEFRGNYTIKISAPERAILEVMEQIVDASSFEDAANIMNGFLSLNEELLFELLSSCNSRRVKRLFLFLAKHSQLPIYDVLKNRKIDLGKGVLQIIHGGTFVKEFGITVPYNFANKEDNPF